MDVRSGIRRAWQAVLGVALVTGTGAAAVQSPAPPAGMVKPANEAEEIAMALGALPASMRASATVYVLGPKGYRQARAGTSGVHCLVERSRPDTQEPICWDREGSETIMPAVMAQAEWRAAGLSEADIKRKIDEGFAAGTFRAPRRPGVAYMLSAHNWVFNGQRVIHYQPHLMMYAPYLTNKDIGTDGKDPAAPWILNEGSPHAYMIVATRQ